MFTYVDWIYWMLVDYAWVFDRSWSWQYVAPSPRMTITVWY